MIKCQINPDLCSNAGYLGSLPWDLEQQKNNNNKGWGGGQFWKVLVLKAHRLFEVEK